VSTVELEHVSKRYGDIVAVDDLDLAVRDGEFLTLLGPSGCGKTTTLRMIAGLVAPSAGTIGIGSGDVTHVPPQRRSLGMVFQDYALFPHLTVAENIAFGMVERRVAKSQIRQRVAELLDLIRLPQGGERYPSQISGGQQQRVALARAVAVEPQVLLMDEPLGALDLKLREVMQIELRNIQQALSITTIYVTHDQAEAMSLSDRIAVINGDRIEQLGTPAAIYERPRTRFVAGFIGKINFFAGNIIDRDGAFAMLRWADRVLRAPAGEVSADNPGEKVILAVRPEHIAISRDGDDGGRANRIAGTLVQIVYTGNLVHALVELPTGETVIAEGRPAEFPLDRVAPSSCHGVPATVFWLNSPRNDRLSGGMTKLTRQ
jgi:spermidine/putrescine transport system ATP-binding protein